MVNIQNGSFVADGSAKTLVLRSGLDTLEVWNKTESAAANANHGVSYVWNLGMASNDGIVTLRNGAATAINTSTAVTLTVPGFKLIDSSIQTPGASVATTDTGAGANPTILTANTSGMSDGAIVRLFSMTGAAEFNGYDFTIDNVVDNTSFDLAYSPFATVAAAAAGHYRYIAFDPIYYPRNRYITGISQAAEAVITLSVTHGFQIGQQIRIYCGSIFGMTEIDGLKANIVDVDTTDNTITVDIDSTGFTAFVIPLTAVAAAGAYTPAQVVPVGEDTALALAQVPPVDVLTDATINTGYVGMVLGAGITSPAGSNGDVIYWRATSSFNL